MPKFFEITLESKPQRFSISLAGKQYSMRLRWRAAVNGGWVLDISTQEGAPIVEGIPLVTGANLLEQYPHLGFAGRLWVQTSDNPDAPPTFNNLGSASKLYFVTD